jgi:hypothetical protein
METSRWMMGQVSYTPYVRSLVVLNNGVPTEELDFGFYPSSATTASSVDTDGAGA